MRKICLRLAICRSIYVKGHFEAPGHAHDLRAVHHRFERTEHRHLAGGHEFLRCLFLIGGVLLRCASRIDISVYGGQSMLKKWGYAVVHKSTSDCRFATSAHLVCMAGAGSGRPLPRDQPARMSALSIIRVLKRRPKLCWPGSKNDFCRYVCRGENTPGVTYDEGAATKAVVGVPLVL